MALTVEWHVFTGNSSDVKVSPQEGESADNINLTQTGEYDKNGVGYKNNSSKIKVQASSTGYSYELYIRLRFRGTGNSVSNVKVHLSDFSLASLYDSGIKLNAGKTSTYTTPVNSQSSIATNSNDDWDEEEEAIDITPSGGITSFPEYSDYLVIQLEIPPNSSVEGEIGEFELTVNWDET